MIRFFYSIGYCDWRDIYGHDEGNREKEKEEVGNQEAAKLDSRK